MVALAAILSMTACGESALPEQVSNPPSLYSESQSITEDHPASQNPTVLEPDPRPRGVPLVMPEPPEGELADELLGFVHRFSREFIFPQFAGVAQMDFEDASVSSNLLLATRIELGDQWASSATIDDMNMIGRRFFGNDFVFPRGIETWDIASSETDEGYIYFPQARGGMTYWNYLLLDYDISGDRIIATFFPFNAFASWEDGAIEQVRFLYPYDMSNVTTSRESVDVMESVAYLEDRVLPGYDGHILNHVFLGVPQKELGTIIVTFLREESGNLIAMSSKYNR
jgi:hypothetical protein